MPLKAPIFAMYIGDLMSITGPPTGPKKLGGPNFNEILARLYREFKKN